MPIASRRFEGLLIASLAVAVACASENGSGGGAAPRKDAFAPPTVGAQDAARDATTQGADGPAATAADARATTEDVAASVSGDARASDDVAVATAPDASGTAADASGSTDTSIRDAASGRDGGGVSSSNTWLSETGTRVACAKPGVTDVPSCLHWQGTPAAFSGALPVCPYNEGQPDRLTTGQDWGKYTCLQYCACWFNGDSKCSRFKGNPWSASHAAPATDKVFETPGECLAACEAFDRTKADWGRMVYRINNNDFHCWEGVVGEMCPIPGGDNLCSK